MRTRSVLTSFTSACVGVLFAALVAHAQNEGADHPIHGVRTPGTWLADSVVRRRCPAFVQREKDPPGSDRDAKPVATWCAVDTTYTLPAAGVTRWLGAGYTRFVTYPADSALQRFTGRTRDTVRIRTAVLYAWRDHVLEWSPVWVGTVDAEYTRSVRVDVAARPDRSHLAGVTYCINGTGGCWQRYMRWVNGRWTEVKEIFWSQLPAIPGGRIGKGPGIDLETLAGSYGVYAPNDPNCCPSRELRLQLVQRGDSLLLASHEIRPTPSW